MMKLVHIKTDSTATSKKLAKQAYDKYIDEFADRLIKKWNLKKLNKKAPAGTEADFSNN